MIRWVNDSKTAGTYTLSVYLLQLKYIPFYKNIFDYEHIKLCTKFFSYSLPFRITCMHV